MPLLKKLNRFEQAMEVMNMAETALVDRLQELEIQNSHLQSLVVELLDKNERLRAQLEKA